MIHTIDDFAAAWTWEAGETQKLFDRLTDGSLAQAVNSDGRTIGRLAWHIAQTIPEMMARTGLHVTGIGEHDPVPAHAAEISSAYRAAAASLLHEIKTQWTDATLTHSDDMYGMQWPRSQTLWALIGHQTHHRGQLTVLMRQADLVVPGIYGPAREEWEAMGTDAPTI